MLTTERLLLTPLTRAEALAITNGERADRWAADYPTEGDVVVAGLMLADPTGADGEWGAYQLALRDTGVVVGGAGFKGPPRDGAVEIGYGLAGSARGQGLATEAVLALVRHALAHPAVTAVEAEVEFGNDASERVLQRAGFVPVAVEGGMTHFRRER